MKLDPFGWGGLGYEETGEDPSRLGCLLLRRLASKAKVYGAKLVLVIQYAGETIASGGDRPAHITALISCAHLLDIVVVDEFEDLRALVHEKGLQALREQYFITGAAAFGHRTPVGNERIARLIASSLHSGAASNESERPPKKRNGDDRRAPRIGARGGHR